MLVLSRHVGEIICVGNDIQISIVDIRGDKVRLGITAPKEVSVDRIEIRQAKERGNEEHE